MPDSAVMIRARRSTRDALKEIAERRNTSLIDALDQIVRDVREEELIAAVAVSLGEHAHAVALEAGEGALVFPSTARLLPGGKVSVRVEAWVFERESRRIAATVLAELERSARPLPATGGLTG